MAQTTDQNLAITVQAGTGGGSYDNTLMWPSAANRPVLNATNNTLTFIGPKNGGPSTTSDVQQTVQLTKSGPITSTAAGQIIELKNVTATNDGGVGISVQHNNVTVRRCYVKGPPTPGGYPACNISVAQGVTGVVIEDCELNGAGNVNASGSFNVSHDSDGPLVNLTVRRCNMHDYEQMVGRYYQGGVLVIDNYMHDTQGDDADMVEVYCDTLNCFGLTVQHNTFFEPTNTAAEYSFDSAINITNESDPYNIHDIYIINNRFLSMNKNYPNIILVDGTKGTSTIANLKYVNNATLVGNSTAGTGIWQPLGESGKVTHLANSGNIILADSNDSTVTGTLWAGNGVWVSDQIYNGR